MDYQSHGIELEAPMMSMEDTAHSQKIADVALAFLQYIEDNDTSSSSPLPFEDESQFHDHFDPNGLLKTYTEPSALSNDNPIYETRVKQEAISHVPTSSVQNVPVNLTSCSKGGYNLRILGVPSKSRVETQLKLCIQLVNAKGTNVTNWKNLVLPHSLLVTGKRQKKYDVGSDSDSSLKLEAGVICCSDPSKVVLRCFGCIQRERKIMQRKSKSDKKHDMLDSTGEGPQFSVESEQKKILQFYTNPRVDFSFGEVILPTRITCYCRHQEEKVGFQIWVRLKDTKTDQDIAYTVSTPVMITDDHKSRSTRGISTKRSRTETEDDESENSPPESLPLIEKVIPSEGPITGGIEISVLGAEFTAQTKIMFGKVEALGTHYWGPKTLLCILPPSLVAQTVPVVVKGIENDSQLPIMFTYKDDTDRLMLELALQVVGMKLTGRIDDAKQIAMKIVSSNQDAFRGTNRPTGMYEQGFHKELEDLVVVTLEQVLLSQTGHNADLSLQNEFGQTLLILAVLAGSHNLAKLLLQHNADPNVQDKLGYTALMWSIFYGYTGMSQLFLESDKLIPSVCNNEGQTAFQLAQASNNQPIIELFLARNSAPSSNITVQVDQVSQPSCSPPRPTHRQQPITNFEPESVTQHRTLKENGRQDSEEQLPETSILIDTLEPEQPTKNKQTEGMLAPSLLQTLMQYRAIFGIVFFIFIGTLVYSNVVSASSGKIQSVDKPISTTTGENIHAFRPPNVKTTTGSMHQEVPMDVGLGDTSGNTAFWIIFMVISVAAVFATVYRNRRTWKVKNMIGIMCLCFVIPLLVQLFVSNTQ